jgi:hypothetical protein
VLRDIRSILFVWPPEAACYDQEGGSALLISHLDKLDGFRRPFPNSLRVASRPAGLSTSEVEDIKPLRFKAS